MSSNRVKKEMSIKCGLSRAKAARRKSQFERDSLSDLEKMELSLKEIDGQIFTTQSDLDGIFKGNEVVEGKLNALQDRRKMIVEKLKEMRKVDEKQ